MSETIKQSAKDATEWYRINRSKYESLCLVVKSILEKILKKENIPYSSIDYRAKEVDSFSKKCNKDKYKNPIKEIMDKAGIRVITYIDSDVERISNVIERSFKIDPENSVNKSKVLDVNQVGYRSVHYIAKLSDERLKLPDYSEFKDCEFEIQVRTILQHSWAEIEHDRNYKFNGVLPDDIKRRFFLLAGVLELADREFQAISQDIDKYAENVGELTQNGKLDEVPINSTSVFEYMLIKFKDMEVDVSHSISELIIDELKKFGIEKLSDIDKIIPNDYVERANKYYQRKPNTFAGILIDIMMIENSELYFGKSWQQHWGGIEEECVDLISSYNWLIHQTLEKFGIDIIPRYFI